MPQTAKNGRKEMRGIKVMSAANLNGIPVFLRRPEDRTPAKLAIKRPEGTERPQVALHDPAATIHGGRAPVTPDFLSETPVRPVVAEDSVPDRAATPAPVRPGTSRPILPWMARKTAEVAPKAAVKPVSSSDVVDLTARREANPELAPVKLYQELRSAFEADQDDAPEDDDAAFQVTLPRSVIRQIRVLAAEEGTTHRAIILRALRAAGVEIPEGADVDRRAVAAKRRQQA
jgi:hypothetical protein